MTIARSGAADVPRDPVGQPLARRDGRSKVTGSASYAGDAHPPGLLYGVLVGSDSAGGRIVEIDVSEALAVPRVERILTHRDFPRLAPVPVPPSFSERLPLQDDTIRYDGEPVAVVLATTRPAAEEAARLVRAVVEPGRIVAHPPASHEGGVVPRVGGSLFKGGGDTERGDVSAALSRAPHRQSETYIQPSRHHNPMEPSATTARYEGGVLYVIDSTQWVQGVRRALSAALDLPADRVRVSSPHVGGGFGAKALVWPHQYVAAATARLLGRPVQVTLTRAQMYEIVTYQPQLVQTVALGADETGRLTAVDHLSTNVTSWSEDYVERSGAASLSTYAAPNIRVQQRVQRAHLNVPNPMRAPVEGGGLWALGSAMNELADRLGMDPVELRLANYAERHPTTHLPWSSKELRACYREGAHAFGWRPRPRPPERDGHWVIGQGMADCAMGVHRYPSSADVRLLADGTAVLSSGFHDFGTGSSTVFPQVVAGVLGVHAHQVGYEMGDSSLAAAGPGHSSSSTIGVGAAAMDAARGALQRLREVSGHPLPEPPGALAISAAMRSAGLDLLEARGEFHGGDPDGVALHTFGAVFVEVAVDPGLGLIRLRRAVGRYSVGRILNPRTARAQMVGGIIWGWGKAALESSPQDRGGGRWLSKNLAGVMLPVNADIPSAIDVGFVDEVDEKAGPIGGKGIGELGATGVDAAVADAVFHATGKRVRTLPITPSALLT